MSFRSVCETIRDYAFEASKLPLIVSLEVHTSPEQQDIMVEIMKQYWGDKLVELPLNPSESAENTKLPTLKELENKILVKVKRAAPVILPSTAKPTTLQAPAQLSKPNTNDSTTSDTVNSDNSENSDQASAPKPKVVESLSKLGVYFGGYTFKGLDKPGKQQLWRLCSFHDDREHRCIMLIWVQRQLFQLTYFRFPRKLWLRYTKRTLRPCSLITSISSCAPTPKG